MVAGGARCESLIAAPSSERLAYLRHTDRLVYANERLDARPDSTTSDL